MAPKGPDKDRAEPVQQPEQPLEQQQLQSQRQQPLQRQLSGDEWVASLEATFLTLCRALRPCQGAFIFAAGSVSWLYSRHFTYSVAFWRAFSVLGWPVARRAAKELKRRFTAARSVAQRAMPQGLPSLREAGTVVSQALSRLQAVYAAYNEAQRSGDAEGMARLSAEMQGLQEDLARAQEAGSALSAVSAELEPETLLEVLRGLHAAIVASLKAGMEHSAGMLGFRGNIGDSVATAVNSTTAPWLRERISFFVSRSTREVQQLAEDQWGRRLLEYAIRAVSNSVGIAIAAYVESLSFQLTNARVGASIIVRELMAPLRGSESTGTASTVAKVSEYLLCGCGLYWQVYQCGRLFGVVPRFLLGGHKMPGLARLVLAGPLLVETWLACSVAAMRAGILE